MNCEGNDSVPALPVPALMGKRSLACCDGVTDVFRALDDETRRLILDGLANRDGQTLFEICTLLAVQHGVGSTRQAISQHLAVLEDAGLLTTERHGRSKFHYFNSGPLVAIAERWPIDRNDAP